MRHRQAPLGHHLHQVAQTELEAKIPAPPQDDDFAVEVATLEQLRYRLQLAHRRPQPAQHANVVDRSPPFAPEPLRAMTSALGQEDRFPPASASGRCRFVIGQSPGCLATTTMRRFRALQRRTITGKYDVY